MMASSAQSARGLKRLLGAGPCLSRHVGNGLAHRRPVHHGRAVLGRTASTGTPGSGTTTTTNAGANTNTSGGAAAAETRLQELLGYARRSFAQHHASEHASAPHDPRFKRATIVDIARFLIGSVITIPLAGWVGNYTYDYIYRVDNCVKQLLEHEVSFTQKNGGVSRGGLHHATTPPCHRADRNTLRTSSKHTKRRTRWPKSTRVAIAERTSKRPTPTPTPTSPPIHPRPRRGAVSSSALSASGARRSCSGCEAALTGCRTRSWSSRGPTRLARAVS